MKKNMKTIAAAIMIVMFVLVPTVLISGCVQQSSSPEIKTQEQATKAVSNISQDVQDVSKVLDDIDKSLG